MLKKVLLFVHGGIGGAERVTVTYAKILVRNGFDVTIVFICNQLKGLETFVPTDIRTIHCKIINIYDFATARIFWLLKQEKPDAVFSSIYYLNLRVVLAAKIAGIKNIVVRNDNSFAYQIPMYQFLARKIYPLADRIVLQSDEMMDELKREIPAVKDKVITRPNPIDIDSLESGITNAENPYLANRVNYVYVGRITPIKGIDVLIKAFNKVHKSNPLSHLTIVGTDNDAQYTNQIKALISEYGLTTHISFTGLLLNPFRYIKYADALVLTSRLEGNPNVVHEAMWLHCPVVVTRSIPIIDKIVTPDRGIVVDVDDIDGVANAMSMAVSMKINQEQYKPADDDLFTSLFNN